MYIDINEITSHLTQETVMVVSNGDTSLLQAAIDGAVVEAKGYLSAFDTAAVFAAVGNDRNQLLLIFIKDIAAWHFLNLCSAGADFRVRQDRYDRAVAWLRAVQKGDVNPDLPRLAVNGQDVGSGILYGSNPKRGQHY